MKPQAAVLKQTGFDKDPEVLAEHGGAQLGAAERLPRGRYVLQAKIRVAARDVELGGALRSA